MSERHWSGVDFGLNLRAWRGGSRGKVLILLMALLASIVSNSSPAAASGTGGLKLAKSLTGGPYGFKGPFRINYDCTGTGFDGSAVVYAGSYKTIGSIPPGTVCTISETLPTPPSGYSFGAPTFSPSATATIQAGTTVRVTTNNTLTRGTGGLKLAKSLTGGPYGFKGPFRINYDCTGTGFDGSAVVYAGSYKTIGSIPPGTVCTISETLPTPPSGYSFGAPTFSPSATATIQAGTTVRVTTNNTLTRGTGGLKLAKSLTGGPYGFKGPFRINYDCTGTGFDGSAVVYAGSYKTIGSIPPGTVCTISETLPTPPSGYSFGAPTFSPSATATIQAGTTVRVTTNNTLTRGTGGLIVIVKDVVGALDGVANFHMPAVCGGIQTVFGEGELRCAIVPGTYPIAEGDPGPEFALTGLTCDDDDSTGDVPSRTATVVVGPGETVTCTFTNTDQRGLIVIVKDVVGALDGVANFHMPAVCGGIQTVFGEGELRCAIVPGTYPIAEGDPGPEFALTGLTCDDDDSTGDVPSRTATVVVGPGETVTCTFTNTDQRGLIVIVKDVVGALDGVANFHMPAVCGGIQTVFGEGELRCAIVPGTYPIAEGDPGPEFALTGLTCDDDDSTGDVPSRTATVVVGPGETVTCTFTNTDQRGLIVIVKDVVGALDGVANFHMPAVCGGIQTVFGEGELRCAIVPGTYPIAEGDPGPEFALTGLTCDDDDSTGDVPSRTATVVVGPGETVTCTFTNTDQRGLIVIVKDVVGALDGVANFHMPAVCGGIQTVFGEGELRCAIVPGTYPIAEGDPGPEFALTGLTCDDDDSTGDVPSRTATVVVGPGETVTCTFTNTDQRGLIVIVKDVVGALDGVANFHMPAVCGGIQTVFGEGELRCAIVPGTYPIAEGDPGPEFALTGLTCDDDDSTGDVPSRTATVVVGPGETVTCTFTNTDQRGLIVIVKDVVGALDGVANFHMPAVCGGIQTVFGEGELRCAIVPGTYPIAEGDPGPEFALTGLTCDDDDSTGDVPSRTATVVVGPGETVTCTFTNTDQRGLIVIVKDVVGALDGVANFHMPAVCGGIQTVFGEGELRCAIVPGTYPIAEGDPGPEFALTGLTCDDDDSTGDVPSRTATVVVGPGETVTCTFTNTDQR